MKRTNPLILPLLFLLWMATGCSSDDAPTNSGNITWHERTVAVVLPMQNGLDAHWKRTLEWVARNLEAAFRNQSEGIRLKYEWYDESTEEVKALARTLSEREEVVAVIGGLYSSNAEIMAPIFTKYRKPFLTPATTAELVRAYSDGYLWAMTETDITQCEVLLAKALYYGAESVALLANGEDSYGKTFIDWFAFQADELGLQVKGIYPYSSTNLIETVQKVAASEADFVVCIPSEVRDVAVMQQMFHQQAVRTGTAPRTLYSDTAYGSDVLLLDAGDIEGLEGVAFSSDPESGFGVSYKVYFEEEETLGESQMYDAAMLVGYAAWMQYLQPELGLNEALRKVVDGREEPYGGWLVEDMCKVIDALATGIAPDVRGASGSLNFDSKVYTNVLHTTYSHFKIYNGHYITLDYNSSDGSKRTDATLAGWNWKVEQMQEFDETVEGKTYPDLQEKWALLVAGSCGWQNYRHQADVLAMYQLLKQSGYTDDHIVLIMEDDIAWNSANPNGGVVQVAVGGENLYHDLLIDYHLSDLKPEDIGTILSGEVSERLPEVIQSTSTDNVLFFWSGHGNYQEFCWGDTDMSLSASQLQQFVQLLSGKEQFRKLLCLVETCYSGSMLQVCEGVPGLLGITAASPWETSKADIFNGGLGVWMSNRFTSTLLETITDDPPVSLRDLYYKLFINTVGSHVMIYNQKTTAISLLKL